VEAKMRGSDGRTDQLFSHVSCEALVPADHPLRVIRMIVDEALEVLSGAFEVCTPRRDVRPAPLADQLNCLDLN